MASPGMNSAFDELLGEGSNSENDPGNPEICRFIEFSAQMEEERRMHAFGFGNSDCEDESIPAQLYDIDNQGCAVRYDESSDGEEIFDDPGQKFATDDDGAARKNEDDGEDRARQVVKLLVIVFAGSARAKQAVSVTIGGADDDSGAEMPSGWIISGKTVWEGKDTHFTSDHPVVGGILLPRSCDINSKLRASGEMKNYFTNKHFMQFFLCALVDEEVKETKLYMKKLPEAREALSGIISSRRGNNSCLPASVRRFCE